MKKILRKLRSSFLSTLVLCSLNTRINAQTGENLNFGSGSDYIQIPSLSFGTNWTAEAWIGPTNLFGNWNVVLGQMNWNANQGFVIAVQNGSVFVNGPGSNGSNGVNLSTPVTGGVWTHVAVTYNNGIWAFYKNGTLVGTQIAPFTAASNGFYLGTRKDNTNSTLTDYYTGDMDEVRIWNTTRSQCDIMSYRNCEISTTAAGLIANYHFNQGTANGILNFVLGPFTLTDATGNGNTGSLNNFNLTSSAGTSNWTNNGCPAQNLFTPTIPSPEINVKGNSVNIVDGDASSSTTDFTDFNGQYTRTFVIESTGTNTLNVGTPVFTGANASDFSVTVVPASVLAATTGTTSFVVAFTPTSVGTKSAIVNIYNSDCSEPIYDFVITATAVTASALDFDGVNDYVETGANLAELGQADFTIEAWIKTTGSSEGIVTCANSNTTWETGEKSFYLDASGTPMFVGWGNNYIVGNITVNNGVWHHVAVVWDYNSGVGSFGKMYVDGVDHTSGSSYAGNYTNFGTFKIGKQNYGGGEAPNNFDGTIDEVRIWNRALCLPEIINNMNCELPSPTTQVGLNGYYKFNTGLAFGTNTTVTTAPDAAVFANNGTLTNFGLTGGISSNWVNPGGVTSGSTCSAYLDEEINLQGNSTTINSGDISPSITDHTDFGLVNVGSVLSRTFVIQNVGTAALSISAYSLSGANASNFTITTNPGASVPAAGNTSIVVSFSASVTGLKTASLTIANSDCDEGVYRFVINATGVVPAAALNFDGVNDYVQMADPNFGTSDCTIEAWFNTSIGGGYLITTRSSEPGPSGNWFAVGVGTGTNAGAVGIELAASTGTYGGVSTPPGCFTPGTWSHLAIVRSGSQIYIYVNGILRASATEPVTRNFVTGNNVLRLGGWVNFNAAWYNGSLDEVRLWTVARTQCEIQSYMNCEIPTTATNLVGNYHFNQGYNALSNSTITTVTDASASGRTGTITNFALSGATSNWLAPGGVVSGTTTVTSPVAEIDLRGNGNSIIDGNTSTSTIDFTDFGGALTRTFTIHNTVGGGTLNIGNLFITGANASQFSITSLPTASVVGTGSTSFVVAFTPTSTGVKSATVNINNNDCSEPLYDFVITATAVAGADLSFDGTDDYIDLGSSGTLKPTSALTAEAWVFSSAWPSNDRTIFGNTENAGYGIFTTATGQLQGLVRRNSAWGTVATPLASLSAGWHHVALTYDGRYTKLYVDGIFKSIDDAGANYSISYIGNNTLIGGEASGGALPIAGWFFNGNVDELRVWNVERTECDIQSYMNCEIPTTASGLLANYHFNQGIAGGSNSSVTSLTDFSGNSLTGTLTSMALNGTTSNWITPPAVVSGFTTSSAPTATLNVYGNGNIVPMGVSTSTTNNTDFGLATNRTFLVHNLGVSPLYVNTITFSGANAANFSVTSLPSASIAGSSNSPFIISFTPTAVGSQSAIVNIGSNDCASPSFSFVITASTVPAEALNFDGINDVVDCGTNSSLDITAGTWEAWVKLTDLSDNRRIFFKELTDGSGTGAYESYFLNSDGKFHGDLKIGLTTHYVIGNLSPVINTWYHVAATYDGTSFKLYVNGVLDGITTSPSGPMNPGTGHLSLGAAVSATGSSQMWGSIDEARLWNVARTQCEIQTYMNCEIPGTASGLIANYHFNQGVPSGSNTSVTALADATGNNPATLIDFSLTGGSVSNWVSPSQISSGYTTAATPNASISVNGNGNAIPIGVTTTTTNFTDFGSASTRTYVLQNAAATGTLYLNSFNLSGANAGDFSVTTLPSSAITTGSTNFVINFIPTAIGTRSAIVTINSSDCISPNYSFVITASATTGEAINIDGIDDNIGTPVFNTQTIDNTLQAKVLWNGNNGQNHMVAYNGNSSTNGYGIYVGVSGAVSILFGSINFYPSNYTLTPGVWTSLTAVIKSGLAEFYVNGILTNSVSVSGPNTPTASFNIGCNSVGTEIFNGNIDEVLLWNRALSQCEIQANQNCEIATSGSSLVANYHFNQGIASGINPTVTTLTDASGNNHNLTLSNLGLSGSTSNWITPGAVSSGSSCPAFTAPEINIVSNALSIPDGNTLTSTSDNTDFGNISLTGNIIRTYTIQNTGAANLAITTISMSGADASSFSVSALSPASPITASNSAVFSLTFAPTSAGNKSAIVNIINNDCDEATYDFVVTGTSTVGAAFTFDGTNDYINCGNILPASYTKEAWVKFSTSSNGNNFLSAGNVTNGSALWAPGIYNYSLSAGHDGAWNQVQDNVAMVPGNWYHIAVTYDAPSLTMVLYKNGVAVSTNTNVPPFTGTSPLHIGAFSGTYVATGSIDEVRIWNRPLCLAEIQNNMNCEIPTTAPGLIANYHFNQGVANGSNTAITTLTDASGSANTGTLVNIASTGTISNWVATSTVTSGSSCSTYFAPEINLVGNAQSINDGDITPSLLDHTDFGGICVNGQIVRTFTIQNTGNANLTVSSVTMSGTSASLYTVGLLTPASPITPSNLAVFSVSFSPTSSGVKTATINITNNDCNENPYDFVVTGTCNALPVVTATTTNSVVCYGATTSLNGLGADTYTWSGSVTNGVSFTPSITTTYSVTGTNTLTGCTSTNSALQTITVNANPTLTANSSHTVICNGVLSPTLTATGAGTSGTYTWNPGAISGTSVSPSPSSTTVYSVAATSSAGCLSTNTVAITVSVNALPTVTALTANSVICLNFTTSLNGAGADTYTWTGGVTNGQTFTPTTTQSYSVTGTNTLTGCVSTNIAVQTITVNPLPTVNISTSNSVICDGTSATLTASGANTYTWNPGNLQGTTITPSPSALTTYSMVGTSTAGCTSTNTSVQSISVNPIPTVTATISNSIVCSGNTITLNGLGAATYTWSNGVADGSPFSPTATSVYTLNGTNSAGCTNTNLATVSVTVNALPQLSVTVSNPVICFGNQSTLSGSGASTYSWSGGISNNLAFSPTTTTEYTLNATDANNCQNTTVATITVNALPVLTVSSTNSVVCEAQSATLTVSGASSYSWNTGANTPDIVITPTNSISFTVNATDVNSCTNTVVYTQSVAPCPGTFSAWAVANNVSCSGKDDGSIAIKYSSSYVNPKISYVWNPQTLCAANTCDSISKLAAGRYGVTVKLTYTLKSILVKTDSVVINTIDISDQNGACEVKVFTGISANNDGVNDVMIIENIEEFPNNKVTVFNRWGQLVFEKKGYNNTDIVWPTGDEASRLNSNTYFYVIDLGDGSKIMKGWVELIKN